MLRYDIVDVFTDQPFAGNQLAVVHGAEGLDDHQLLALTCEFGYSETAFPSRVSGVGYSVRIFTPGGEIPFAGHPTLGTAWVLRHVGALTEETVAQTCGAGVIDVTFGGDLVALRALPGDLVECPAGMARGVLTDLGLENTRLVGDAYLAGAGLTFLYLEVEDAAVAAARPATRAVETYDGFAGLALRDPVGGIDVFSRYGSAVHTRMFSPGLAGPEDAATGSAAAGLGLVLAATGVFPDGGQVEVSQGAEIGRPSRLLVSVTATAGMAESVTVAGAVQPIASGEIAIPPKLG